MKDDGKNDIYLQITNTIVAELEKGVRPWAQPWVSTTIPCRPLRATTEAYRGINVLLLWLAASRRGFRSHYWLTYRQAVELGAFVRKGEKATMIVYFGSIAKTEEDDNGEEREKTIPFLKTYAVFNADQMESLPEKFLAPPETEARERFKNERNERVEQFFKNAGVQIEHGGNIPHYSILYDRVQMPPFDAFKTADDYYSVLGHEAIHWVGHPSRSPRNFKAKCWGNANYAREELVAEVGAAFLCADLGLSLEPRADHAEYIAGWLDVLRNDKRAIFQAAAMAQKAVDYLHALQATEPATGREADRMTA